MISESEFYMWRTIFSLAHADHVIAPEELRFMKKKLEELTLSLEQHDTLESDMTIAQNPTEMFAKITDQLDQAEFFKLARNLVLSDGDYHTSEQTVMAQLQDLQVIKTDVDKIVGTVILELEEDSTQKTPPKKKGFLSRLLISLFTKQV